jgi:hypothetical protein
MMSAAYELRQRKTNGDSGDCAGNLYLMKTTVKSDKKRILAVDDQASNTRLEKLC